jgi:hypothetical protein
MKNSKCVTVYASKDISKFYSYDLNNLYIVRGRHLFTSKNKYLNKLLGINKLNK